MGLGHSCIGDELVQFGNPFLINVDQGIEPANNAHQFKEQQIPCMPLLYMYQLVLNDTLMVLLQYFIPQKDGPEKRKGHFTVSHHDPSKILKIPDFALGFESINLV